MAPIQQLSFIITVMAKIQQLSLVMRIMDKIQQLSVVLCNFFSSNIHKFSGFLKIHNFSVGMFIVFPRENSFVTWNTVVHIALFFVHMFTYGNKAFSHSFVKISSFLLCLGFKRLT